jgi:hypothetical protein
VQKKQELLEQIASQLADYRKDDIQPIDTNHVDRWIGQFAVADHLTILAETARMLEQRYVSRDDMEAAVRQLLSQALNGLTSQQLDQVQLLDITRKGGSQKELVAIARQIGIEKHKHDFTQPSQTPDTYLYLDDCLFTGNTVLHDLRGWLSTIDEALPIRAVHLLFHTIHSFGVYHIKKQINKDEKLTRLKGKVSIHNIKNIANSSSHGDTNFQTEPYECFWPEEFEPVSLKLQNFINDPAFNPRLYTPRLYRPPTRKSDAALFSSPGNRRIVEQHFLERGAFIVAQPRQANASMRPMGYESLPSLGFGAMYVTYRNISNNCPLVLWWGDPNKPMGHPFRTWYPLIPRSANETQ